MTTLTAPTVLSREASLDEPLQRLLEQCAITHPDMDLDLIARAYHFSKRHHEGHVRKSGEPYMVHPCQVAMTLIELHMDGATVAAGLLHDVAEDDPNVSIEQLEGEFGAEVASLVDGVTKIKDLTYQMNREERQVEYFRKMLMAIARDVRVVMIKLADRLHNMRTLSFMTPEKQIEISQETRDIYAPLAHRFGMAKIKSELEDLSFRYLEPEACEDISNQVDSHQEKREQLIHNIQQSLEAALREAGITATIKGRVKHLYSIYTKIQSRHKSFDEIYDLLALRVITDTVRDCYHAFGIIHNLYNPMFDRIKDYIARPKMNMYQSLHTTVVTPNGETVEIQIRTREMDRVAEVGIAAHWLYKENKAEKNSLARPMGWLQQWIDLQNQAENQEFMDLLRKELYPDSIYVFTPKGELKELPEGATALDFAFAIHTDIGFRCTGARINGRMAPLGAPLRSGDTVSILTSTHQKPNPHWIDLVKSPRAISKIRAWLKKATYDDMVELGSTLLDRELKRLKIRKKPPELLEEIAQGFGLPDVDHLYAAIGRGEHTAAQIGQKLVPVASAEEEEDKESFLVKFRDIVRKSTGGVKIRGVDNLMIRFAQCCQPVPGEAIRGFITRGRGVTIHRRDCRNITDDDMERILDVDWDVGENQSFLVGLRVLAMDRKGLLGDLSRTITDAGVNITNATMDTDEGMAVGRFTVEVSSLKELERLLRRIKKVKGVDVVERQSGTRTGKDALEPVEMDSQ
jgi:GTP pyrophosphokinase